MKFLSKQTNKHLPLTFPREKSEPATEMDEKQYRITNHVHPSPPNLLHSLYSQLIKHICVVFQTNKTFINLLCYCCSFIEGFSTITSIFSRLCHLQLYLACNNNHYTAQQNRHNEHLQLTEPLRFLNIFELELVVDSLVCVSTKKREREIKRSRLTKINATDDHRSMLNQFQRVVHQ